MPSLKELGSSTIVGFLLGMIAVWYIDPRSDEGIGLLIVICVLISILTGRMVMFFLNRRGS